MLSSVASCSAGFQMPCPRQLPPLLALPRLITVKSCRPVIVVHCSGCRPVRGRMLRRRCAVAWRRRHKAAVPPVKVPPPQLPFAGVERKRCPALAEMPQRSKGSKSGSFGCPEQVYTISTPCVDALHSRGNVR